MKKLYILLIAALFFSQLTYAQQGLINKLTEQEFDQIKINDILIGDLIDTRGRYSDESTPVFRDKVPHLFRSKVRQLAVSVKSLSSCDNIQT